LVGDVEAEAGAAAFVVEFEDGFEAVEGAVVHVGAGLGGVADGWGFEGAAVEGEGVDLKTALIGAELEPGFGDCAKIVGFGGAEDFEFGLGVIGWDEAVEKGDEVAGCALSFAHE